MSTIQKNCFQPCLYKGIIGHGDYLPMQGHVAGREQYCVKVFIYSKQVFLKSVADSG
jgi:hypothetical protein